MVKTSEIIARNLELEKAQLDAQSATKQSSKKPVRVYITGVEIPTGDLVMLLVKLAVASIPAALIIAVFVGGLFAVLSLLVRLAG